MAKRVVEESRAVRRSAAQGRALVERWRASGESIAAFCRQAGVRAQVLHYWLGRERRGAGRGVNSSDFFVVTAPQRPPQTETAFAEPRLSSAFIVVVPGASPGVIAHTVRELLAETHS
jgi:transposase-like protein